MKTRIVKSMGTDARALPKAPEQTLGYAGCESDIYSLAKVLIEMLTGKTALQLFPDAALDLPDRIRKFLALAAYGLSENSIGLIAAALEFDPQRRPPDVLLLSNSIAADLDPQATSGDSPAANASLCSSDGAPAGGLASPLPPTPPV
jgi:serine/threonine protein kinase